MEKFLRLFLGTADVPTYLAAFAFALIGALIILRIKAGNRDKHSPRTPPNFSWKFLVQDNLQQLINSLLMTFVVFRFSNELVGKDLTMYFAVGVGLCNSLLASFFEKVETKAREMFK